MNQIPNNYRTIEQMTGRFLPQKMVSQKVLEEEQNSFASVLSRKTGEQEMEELRFSKHANKRLACRNIDLSEEQLVRLENGTNKAREKGIKESLVMVDDLAFIVNTKNNIVVTAVNDTGDTVFTNIDGAVIS